MMDTIYYIGVDPGASGAMVILGDSKTIDVIRLDGTLTDIWNELCETSSYTAFALLEQVHSFPGQGVSSTFKFGMSFGIVQAMLTAACIPYELITPQQWQKKMRCLSKGDKNVTKAAAQRLFPKEEITHRTADAMLLAELARRTHTERQLPSASHKRTRRRTK